MSNSSSWKPRMKKMLVVAPASPYTWTVAFARRVIPGAIFSSKAAALVYAFSLAIEAGLDGGSIKVLGTA